MLRGFVDIAEHANSLGNLVKFRYKGSEGGKYRYVKFGRLHMLDFWSLHGIEPVIEVVASKVGALMGLDMLGQELSVEDCKGYTGLACTSEEYKRHGEEEVTLKDLIDRKEIPDNSYASISGVTSAGDVNGYLIADYIFANEDRHARNISWLYGVDTKRISPIFDNGMSLLFSSYKSLLSPNFSIEDAMMLLSCNSFYYTFDNIPKHLESVDALPKELVRATRDDIEDVIGGVEREYRSLDAFTLSNVLLNANWFKNVADVIIYRKNRLVAELEKMGNFRKREDLW